MYAFVGTKPPVPEPGEWRWRRAPETAPVGQRLYMNTAGCGQCHEPENAYGRMWLGEHAKEVDFDYFARQIYEHTDKYPRGRMGTYRRERLPEAVLREIYEWMVIDIGMRASIGAVIEMGERRGEETRFTVTLTNRGVTNVGLDVQGVTVFVRVPPNMKLVGGTGAGYQGVQPLATLAFEPRLPLAPHSHDDSGHVERPRQDLSGDVVVWKFPHMAAGEAPHCVARRIGQAPSPPQLAYFLLPGTSRNRRYRGNCADLRCGGKGGYEDRRGMTGCR